MAPLCGAYDLSRSSITYLEIIHDSIAPGIIRLPGVLARTFKLGDRKMTDNRPVNAFFLVLGIVAGVMLGLSVGVVIDPNTGGSGILLSVIIGALVGVIGGYLLDRGVKWLQRHPDAGSNRQ
jgi:hypothetical protein